MQTTSAIRASRNILFVCAPADGHFSPLTGLAKHLQSIGHDVRWYTQSLYADKLKRLGIPHYPYVNALEINQDNFGTFFADRDKHKSQTAKFKFDLEHVFIKPTTTGMMDLELIYREFPFDIVIADIFSFTIPMIRAKFKVPVIAGGIIPLMATSRDLPPSGLGLTPTSNMPGRMMQSVLRKLTDAMVFSKPTKMFNSLLKQYGVSYPGKNVFDILYSSADVVLQSGTPGFEYRRKDLNSNIHYAGPMLPYAADKQSESWFNIKLTLYKKIILLTQGTVEKDPNKLIVPTIEAFKNSEVLVVCTTGGSDTGKLREKYNHPNVIIEDFIPFGDVMPYADVYITNGGYGGVTLSIQNELPMVVAGVHEGKNEICARVGYFNYGINLKTEKPKPEQIRKAVNEVLTNPVYKTNVQQLRKEFAQYNANEICAKHVAGLTQIAPKSKGRTKVLMNERVL
jgi:MGT family glycosyltransferase